jgi:hypothetical protein
MAKSERGVWWFLLAALLLAAGAGGYLAFRAARGTDRPMTYQPSTAPSTRPATTSISTRPTTRPKPPTTSFIDVVRAVYPTYTTTRPLALPVRDLAEAARIVLTDPIYMGPSYRPDLWITRADGAPAEQILRRVMDPKQDPVQVHVLHDTVRFVHWNPGEHAWTPYLVCERSDGGLEVVSHVRRRPLPVTRAFDWGRASSWNDKIIVPSEAGVSVFRFEPELTEDYRQLIDPADASDAGGAAPQALLDYEGLLAWVPSEGGEPGSRGAARYVKDQWADLGPEQGWPERILHLVPLRDGSVLRFEPGEDGAVKLAVVTLFNVDIDEQAVAGFVEQLSDPDAERREAAYKELAQYGPGVYPILEKLVDGQPPEARARLRQLMRDQVQPTLGGMTLLGGKLQTVSRHNDGGAVFFAEEGVSIPREQGSPSRRVPAWLAVRPGRAAEVLDEMFVNELKPDGCEVLAGGNEWVVTGDARGTRRWIGNGFVPLLKKDEAAFTEWLGIDARGRWLFRKPGTGGETLVLDPKLPDPTPRLPFWEYTSARDFGWDHEDWPAVRREGGDWSLQENGWRLLDPKKNEKVLTVQADVDPFGGIVDKAPSKWSQLAARAKPLLIVRDGTRYEDGLTTLRVRSPDGREITWPLPPVATGQGLATLLKAADGALFLFNQPGRVLRIRPTPGEAEPFRIEATFTRKIPSIDKPRRIWMDPAGRIIMADARRLIMFFPEGFIPPSIRDLMPLNPNELE